MPFDNTQAIQRLYDQNGLLDILLGVEEYFSGMDLYAYKNWIDGELVEGPIVSKYWVEVIFKYTKETFPDPRAMLIFERQGTKVTIKEDWEIKPIAHPRALSDMQSVVAQRSSVSKPKDIREPILLVKFQIPRRLVNPESFDEFKLMNADFNDNLLTSEQPMNEEPEQDNSDLDLDEIQGDENELST